MISKSNELDIELIKSPLPLKMSNAIGILKKQIIEYHFYISLFLINYFTFLVVITSLSSNF